MSNRLPFTIVDGARGLERRSSTGGVISSLDAILRRHGGTWIGWPGMTLREGESIPPDAADAYHVLPIHLSAWEVEHYYDGFANRTLWPLLHGMPEHAQFKEEDWRSYERANRRFAETALANVTSEMPIWVNDYHLLLVPGVIRALAPRQRVTFFLHIPFPSEDVFRQCPWHQGLLYGLLGADVVGLQTADHAENLFRAAELLPGAHVNRRTSLVHYAGRSTRIDSYPIGADFHHFEGWARARPKQETGGRIVLGVDRLDYTKGLSERIHAFTRLLEDHPEHRENVVYVQLAVPSRPHLPEYQRLKQDVEALVDDANRKFGTSSWTPIDYRYQSLPQEQLARLYRDADVALVTPICDGMNLVAKEYVASQIECSGVLVLSRSAGASATMLEALTVEATDIGGTAEALHRALVMDEHERRIRMAALRERERRNDVYVWARRFLEPLVSPERVAPVDGLRT
jgi:trehalose 6-phosphate synthase/phosphatase